MTDVLLVAAAQPQLGVLAGAVQKFRAQGARVYLACAFDTKSCQEELDRLELDGYQALPYGIGHLRTATRRRLKQAPGEPPLWIQTAATVGCAATAWERSSSSRSTPTPCTRSGGWPSTPDADASFGIAPALRALADPQRAPAAWPSGGLCRRRRCSPAMYAARPRRCPRPCSVRPPRAPDAQHPSAPGCGAPRSARPVCPPRCGPRCPARWPRACAGPAGPAARRSR